MPIDRNLKSLAGEFAVLSQLALRGIDANLTLGHTKGVDILASDPNRNRLYRLEVKTRVNQPVIRNTLFGNTLEWHMSQKHEDIIDKSLFYCFVDIHSDKEMSFQFFIIPSKVVAGYVKKEHIFYLKERPKNKDTSMRIFRLSSDNRKCPFPAIKMERYKNNWEFKK